MSKVIIIMGSKADLEYGKKITSVLTDFGVDYVMRIASAHKTPLKVLKIIKDYDSDEVVFITIAGRSNALSGFVDVQTTNPVIASPPPPSDACLCVDIFSSLRMPSGVCPMTVLGAENAALSAIKILGIKDKRLAAKIKKYQTEMKRKIEQADKEIINNG
jgi:5-(carboxyamino)imidazole ribonucleotide mutase